MKSLLYVGALLGMTNACNKNTTPTSSATGAATDASSYQLTGQLQNAPAGTKVYLAELGETQFVSRDTATVDDKGQFTFSGNLPEAGIYQVKLDEQNQALVALENGRQVQLTGNAQQFSQSYTVKGSPDSDLLQQISRSMQTSRQQMQRLEQRFNQAAEQNRRDSLAVLQQKALTLQTQGSAGLARLVRQNPNSVVSAFVVTSIINPDDNFALADSVANVLKKNRPDSRFTKALVARLEPLRTTAVGVQAPEISLPSPEGKAVALSSLRGKYVLIDFWASWCGPCRQENPNVVKAYNKFKAKGFEIYSVSFDQDRGKWLKAIQNDKLTWTHVSDLKGWESAAGQTYGIKSIPQSYLLDPQGRIIAKNLRGEALDATLASVLK
ncbi:MULTISPECIES: TlpA disulfide reductase family protein [Hymenobacter]|nr:MULTISPECIES: TlpA disulfide reductase family protein [Hymenobacter]MBB4601889.1 peroxiredoxin [Hymenobacter latericoloratus]